MKMEQPVKRWTRQTFLRAIQESGIAFSTRQDGATLIGDDLVLWAGGAIHRRDGDAGTEQPLTYREAATHLGIA